MNLTQLRKRLDQIEAEAGTDRVSIKLWLADLREGPTPEMTEVGSLNLRQYRDGGEVTNVIWVVPGEKV